MYVRIVRFFRYGGTTYKEVPRYLRTEVQVTRQQESGDDPFMRINLFPSQSHHTSCKPQLRARSKAGRQERKISMIHVHACVGNFSSAVSLPMGSQHGGWLAGGISSGSLAKLVAFATSHIPRRGEAKRWAGSVGKERGGRKREAPGRRGVRLPGKI
jgi:hypothetical protein